MNFSRRRRRSPDGPAKIRTLHRIVQSVGATGGVYKEQGRNQHKMLTCAYETFLVRVPQFQETVP